MTLPEVARRWPDEDFYIDGESPEAPFASEAALDALFFARETLHRYDVAVQVAPVFLAARPLLEFSRSELERWCGAPAESVPESDDREVLAVCFSRARISRTTLDRTTYLAAQAAVARSRVRGTLTASQFDRLERSFARLRCGREDRGDAAVWRVLSDPAARAEWNEHLRRMNR